MKTSSVPHYFPQNAAYFSNFLYQGCQNAKYLAIEMDNEPELTEIVLIRRVPENFWKVALG